MRCVVIAAFAALGLMGPTEASSACRLTAVAEFPVTLEGDRPVTSGEINGQPAKFLIDSGAFYSLMSPAAANQYHLSLQPLPPWFLARGIGGSIALQLAEPKDVKLAGIAMPATRFLVGGGEAGAELAGAIGQNVLGIGDVEYDLPNGVVRLFRENQCRNAELAYWAKPPLTWGVVNLEPILPRWPNTIGEARINGVRIRVTFDTGAAVSILSLSAAKRLGLAPGATGVTASGSIGGAGQKNVPSWVAPVAKFEIGGETILNTHLRLGDVDNLDTDMLVGADFFLAHRVYVAKMQRKLYFTFTGGPVFNLSSAPTIPSSESAAVVESEPTDAEGYARRAAIRTARHELAGAVSDFSKAMSLDPTVADFPLGRGQDELESGDRKAARADFDLAIRLNPSDWRARLARARLSVQSGDTAGALTDLEAADRAMPSQANHRLILAGDLLVAWAPDRALKQYETWIRFHPVDRNLGWALAGRCLCRAVLGVDLGKAKADCDRAIHIEPGHPLVREATAFLRLRTGDLDSAIANFSAVSDFESIAALTHWGRGLAEAQNAMTAQAEADFAAAKAVEPDIEAQATRFGLGAPKT